MADSAESLEAEVHYLEQVGPRLTGPDAQRALVEQVAEQLSSLGTLAKASPCTRSASRAFPSFQLR